MKKIATSLIALALVTASVAFAAGPGPFFAPGDYCTPAWSPGPSNQLTLSAGVWTGAVVSDAALVPGFYAGKVATSDWSEGYPTSNQPVFLTSPGEVVNWTFDTNVYADGWLPATDIVYNDHMIPAGATFEAIGSAPETGNWGSGVACALTGDVWSVEIPIATPGSYEVKFRRTNDWSINAGSDGFGTNSANIPYTTTIANEPVLFQFNQLTGRVRVLPGGGVVPTTEGTWGRLKSLFR